MDDPYEAWQVAEADFPRAGGLEEKLHFFVRYAILAPSSHNTQPWRFRVDGGRVDVLADRRRSLPASDPDDRELTIACGAALLNLRVAVRHFGYSGRVELRPDPGEPDLLARLRVSDAPHGSIVDAGQFAAITHRHTNRSRYEERAVPGVLLSDCHRLALDVDAWFHIVEAEDERAAVAELVAVADRRQATVAAFRAELSHWLHPNRSAAGDGIPGFAFGVDDVLSFAAPLVVRTFDWGSGKGADDRQIALGSPVLAIIGTGADDVHDWLASGQALESVLLAAAAEGVATSYLNQPLEVPELRTELAEQLGLPGLPQILLRMGYAGGVRPTPRRPLDTVLV